MMLDRCVLLYVDDNIDDIGHFVDNIADVGLNINNLQGNNQNQNQPRQRGRRRNRRQDNVADEEAGNMISTKQLSTKHLDQEQQQAERAARIAREKEEDRDAAMKFSRQRERRSNDSQGQSNILDLLRVK